jgi:hypothetical protein
VIFRSGVLSEWPTIRARCSFAAIALYPRGCHPERSEGSGVASESFKIGVPSGLKTIRPHPILWTRLRLWNRSKRSGPPAQAELGRGTLIGADTTVGSLAWATSPCSQHFRNSGLSKRPKPIRSNRRSLTAFGMTTRFGAFAGLSPAIRTLVLFGEATPDWRRLTKNWQ